MATTIAGADATLSNLSSAHLAIERASLGLAGDKAYALLGADLQEGDAEFVAVKPRRGEALHEAQRRAAHEALAKLEARLGRELIYFWSPHPPVALGK